MIEDLIDNKYTKWYFNFIEVRKHRHLPANTYSEIHHIVPKSLGGSDDGTNLIKLTAREHFFAHLLLAHMLNGISAYKMKSAINAMKNLNATGKRYICNSREYEIIKSVNNKIMQTVAKDFTNERQLQGKILSQYTDVTKVIERGVCSSCGILPKAVNYVKEGRIFYRKTCDTCARQKSKPSIPAWAIQGYKKLSNCESCGFVGEYKEQIIVYETKNVYKSICLNCQIATKLGKTLKFKTIISADF
jgi:hypothetical protein